MRRAVQQWGRDLQRAWRSCGWAELFALLLLIGIGAGLRISYLNVWLTSDEAATLQIAFLPLHELIAAYHIPNNHILNTVLIHLGFQIEPSLITLRLPVLIAGILLIPATYAALRRWYGIPVALLVTAVVTLHPNLIYYSVVARGYMLQTLCMMLLIGLLPALTRRTNRLDSVLWVLFTALAFWTLPTSLYFYVGLFLWLSAKLWFQWRGTRRKVLLWRWFWLNVAAVLAVLLLYSPVFIQLGWQALANDYVSPWAWDYFVAMALPTLTDYLIYWFLPASLPFAAVLLIGSVWAQQAWRREIPLPLIIFVVVAGMIVLQRNFAPFRVMTFLIPLVWWCIAVLVVRLLHLPLQRYRPLFMLIGGIMVGGMVWLFPPTPQPDPRAAAIRDLGNWLQPSDRVLTNTLESDILRGYVHLYRLENTVQWVFSETDLPAALPHMGKLYLLTTSWRYTLPPTDLVQSMLGAPIEALPPLRLVADYPPDSATHLMRLEVWDAAALVSALGLATTPK